MCLAVLVTSIAAVACLPKGDDDESGSAVFGSYRYDSWYRWDSGGWSDPGPVVGDFSGIGGVMIVEAGCELVWDLAGRQCSGCDLGWDVSLEVSPSSSCDFGTDTSGVLEIGGGAAYFNGDYWGAATARDGAVSWATAGYIYGAGGYTYAYAGSGLY